ncbi:MAG: 23S rRNA (uracil(1939)-C(5))-methyltransferase RlmD [Bacteroidales bacterium]|nr:23S rRNA (uracil(1939)-C(5))-methyltransferase RlmD [Bacteroidales bacterium]
MSKIVHLYVESLASEGYGIAYLDGKVTFIPFTAPGDEVEAELIQIKRNYNYAQFLKIVKPSSIRIEPLCQHFGTCGGCKWQHLSYKTQLEWKQQFVVDAFERIAKIIPHETYPIVPSHQPFYYRNKMEFSFSPSDSCPEKPVLGFHLPGKFNRVFHVEKCFLQNDFHNVLRHHLYEIILSLNLSPYNRKTHEGFLRNLIIRKNSKDEWMIILVVTEDKKEIIHHIFEKIIPLFPQVISWNYVVNQKKNDSLHDLDPILFYGMPYLEETILQIQFKIRPLSFFQVNKNQAEKLYSKVVQWGAFKKEDVVYDLYTGTGTIALSISPFVKKVIGIDNSSQAIQDAQENARNNSVCNSVFVFSDVAKGFNDSLIEEHGRPNVVILDPPRSGVHPQVIKQLLKKRPERIIYVSCNPGTQARDISMLSELYELHKIQPFDMFPQTAHVENIALLILKNSSVSTPQ